MVPHLMLQLERKMTESWNKKKHGTSEASKKPSLSMEKSDRVYFNTLLKPQKRDEKPNNKKKLHFQ